MAQAQQALAQAGEESGDERDTRRQLKELEAEQQRIRRKMKDLQDLLAKAENPQAKKSAQAAQQKMEDTEKSLDAGASSSASENAEEARRYLEQARQELERERRRYESLRQEELLYKLVQDLKEFRTEQERIRGQVKSISDAAAGGPLARVQRRALRTLADDQAKLRTKVDERVKAVRDEGSITFGTALEGVSIDMAELSRLLGEDQHDLHVQQLASEVIVETTQLIQAFEDEITRRKKPAPPPPPGESGQPPKPVLVPPSVEIKLLRRLQMDLNAKVETLWRTQEALKKGQIEEAQRRTLERLYHQQQKLADDLEALLKSVYRDS
jgi:hypothetical protein